MPVLRQAVLVCCVAVSLRAAAQHNQDRANLQSARQPESPLQQHVQAAHQAQAHANCNLAAQEYHAAVRLMPGSGELRTNEGIALYCDRQLPAAVSAFETALQLNHDLTVPHLFLGFAAYRLGHLDHAAKELNVYLKSAPGDTVGHLWLGYTLAAENDDAAAKAQFQQVLAADPHNLDAEYALGEAALALAHAKALEIQALDPSGAHLMRLAAIRYALSGDAKRAQAASDESSGRLLTAAPKSREVSQKLEALDQEAQQEQKEALDAFAAILDAAPDSYRAHQVTGDALVAAQQQEAAVSEYEAVIHLNPGLPGVHETLSQCLMVAGRFSEALSALNTEVAISPAISLRLETRIGQVKLAMGDTDGAAASLERALGDAGKQGAVVKEDAVPLQAFLLLGQVRLRQARAADAVALLQRYVAADSNNATAFYYLSRAYRSLGNHALMAQALADYQRTSQDARDRALLDPITRGTIDKTFAEVTPKSELSTDFGHTSNLDRAVVQPK